MGIPPSVPYVTANTMAMGRALGSGGGLSSWAGGAGASGGVAGGTTAAGGIKRVVPRGVVSAVGSLLDDQCESTGSRVGLIAVYSDVEFIIIPARNPRKHERDAMSDPDRTPSFKRIYANKKLLTRCDYFEAMFTGGFKEVEGIIEDVSGGLMLS